MVFVPGGRAPGGWITAWGLFRIPLAPPCYGGFLLYVDADERGWRELLRTGANPRGWIS
jgi:hypothetical protein